ncbi:hypothetical protein MSG28_014114 [Choristoneura fumiferana]|uniref:Uncharacterized protein n=1 Tax=Choristoneura fumiferana TaxID=7141 RepID=A0ACC0JFW0_CHOFU|nr:hypothetical protein MSG28_014114 [Choristoneura fumiferana]
MTIAQSLDNECTVQLTKCQINIGHVVIGYTVCWTAPVIQKLQSPDLTPLDKPITDENASWIAAILNVGVIIGSQTGAYLSNVIGRKPTLLLAALLLFTSNVILLLSKNFTSLVVGRVVSGLGVGGTACGNLVYIGEIASPEVRGIILTCTGLLHTLGNLLVFSVGPFVSYSVVEYIVIVMTATHVLGLLSIPESPVYHVIKGLGIIPNVLVGEMFSPNVRSTGSSIAMCLGWVAGFTSGLSFGYIIIIIGSHAIFLSFAVINILGCLFTLKFVPETKGKSLTEIEAMLAR